VSYSLKLFGWCRDVAFDPLVSAAKGSHPRFYRSRSLSLLWLLGILSQRREKFAPFSFVFLGVHFTAFGVLEHITNAVSVCITKFELCFIYFLYNEPKFSLVKSDSCSTAVMYSVCKPDISETFKSEPVYPLLAIISSEHTQQRIWKKLAILAHCRVLFIAVRMFTRHTLDVQPVVLNCECSLQTASTNDWLQPISSCPLPVVGYFSYIWNDQHAREQYNKENTLPTCLCILLACW